MAQTATAIQEPLQVFTERVAMNNPALITLPPHRANILYRVQPVIKLDELSSEWLGYKHTAFPKLCSSAGLSTLVRTVCSYLPQNKNLVCRTTWVS